jgi:site-specific DNA recombinase
MANPRVAIYGRHSTTFQNPESSDDQVRSCYPLVERLGGTVVQIYTDPEVSGYKRNRAGLQALLQSIGRNEVDIIVCEAIDRIARDSEDIAWLGKKLRFSNVRLYTLTEGEIDEMKFAVASMMGSIYLKNLQQKTLRGMKAAVVAGRMAGGRVYGYRKVHELDANGSLTQGRLEINPDQAVIVQRIYRDFAAGKSSYAIATELNSEGIPGPSGRGWNQSTIRGDPKKHVGILHNPLYRGKLVWGRREWRRDPDSDKRERRYRLRDEREWVSVNVPDLRIIDPELARHVRAEVRRRSNPRLSNSLGQTRTKHLLSGLIRCGKCGASYVINGKDYYRCGAKREGKCKSDISIRKSVIEEAALRVIQTQLMSAELAELFAQEFKREVERLRSTGHSEIQLVRDRLSEVETEIRNLAANFAQGIVSPTLATMLTEREAEKEKLTERLRHLESARRADVLPHPALLERYTAKVAKAREALSDPTVRQEATEALRSLIETITIHADDDKTFADIVGDAGKIIEFAAEDSRRPTGTPSSIAVVAGVGFEPTTFRL